MRVAARFFSVAALVTLALVAGVATGHMPGKGTGSEVVQAPDQPQLATPAPEVTGSPELYEPNNDIENAPPLDQKPRKRPVLDLNYDDSWVADFPEVIGGHRVEHITTPRDRACTSSPVIYFVAPQKTMDEFLAAPRDVQSLREAIDAVPGVPSDVALSFSGSPFDKEEWAERNREWNESRIRNGCPEPWGRITFNTDLQ